MIVLHEFCKGNYCNLLELQYIVKNIKLRIELIIEKKRLHLVALSIDSEGVLEIIS